MTFADILTGDASRRLHGVKKILLERADRCRRIAAACDDPNGQFAASLRGKAKGYAEAADLLTMLERGRRLPSKAHDRVPRWRNRGAS